MKLTKIRSVYISGASKGIGFEYAKRYLKIGAKVFAVSRDLNSLIKWAKEKEYENNLISYECDLSSIEENIKLVKILDEYEFDIMINNAGFSNFGHFDNIEIEKELNLIDLNIKSLEYLTKYFYKKYSNTIDEKRIINVASIAAFQPGPLHATYFASKSFVLNLSLAINYELKKSKSKLKVISLCPGSVLTDFWNRANYKLNKKPSGAMELSKFINKSFKKINTSKKPLILIGMSNKINAFFAQRLSRNFVLRIVYKMQKRGI